MAGYIGRAPLSEAVQSRATYNTTTSTTTFSFSYQPGYVDVYYNGTKMVEGSTEDYTATNGTDVVFNTAISSGNVVALVGLKTFSLINGKINYSATTAPVVGDDSADGYRVGSLWVDVTNDLAYTCVDDSLGAAVWSAGGGSAFKFNFYKADSTVDDIKVNSGQFPFYKADGFESPIITAIASKQFPFYKADGTQDNIGVL